MKRNSRLADMKEMSILHLFKLRHRYLRNKSRPCYYETLNLLSSLGYEMTVSEYETIVNEDGARKIRLCVSRKEYDSWKRKKSKTKQQRNWLIVIPILIFLFFAILMIVL